MKLRGLEVFKMLTWMILDVMKQIIILYHCFNARFRVVVSPFRGRTSFNAIWKDSMQIYQLRSAFILIISRHNAPESPFGSSQYARRSIGEASLISGSPPQGSVVHSNQPQGVTSQPMTNPSGAMAIGSIIEPTMRHEYASPAIHTFAEFSHLPVPVAPRMPPELLYGISVSDSPCPSSDSSYSPMSDLIQPHINTNPFSAPDDLPRAQSVSLESTFPQHVFTSPLTATSPVPSWNFDQAPLSAPMQSSMQAAIFPTVRQKGILY